MGIADLNADVVRELLDYEPETGLFRWKKSRRRRTKVGAIAGGLHVDGYMQIKLKEYGCCPFLHRLAFLIMTGDWPKGEVDHIDGVRTNNVWNNLRDTCRTENMCNRKLGSNNRSGIFGVSYLEGSNYWRCRITINKKEIQLGKFDNLLDAASARKSAEMSIGFHANHGRIQR
jgi:hypothetical protein